MALEYIVTCQACACGFSMLFFISSASDSSTITDIEQGLVKGPTGSEMPLQRYAEVHHGIVQSLNVAYIGGSIFNPSQT